MKYKIGDTVFWVYSNSNYNKQIPCTMCFGKLYVTIILGDESQQKVECGFCQRGADRPSGYCMTWGPHAEVKSGVVTGVSTKDGVRYEVGRETIFEHAIFTEDEAKLVCEAKLEEEKERSEKWFRDSFITAKKKQIWSAGYHKECIKKARRDIEWHELRLGMIKEKNTGASEL